MRVPRLAAAVVAPALAATVLVVVPVGGAQAATSTDPDVVTTPADSAAAGQAPSSDPAVVALANTSPGSAQAPSSTEPDVVAPAAPATVCGTDSTMNAYVWASNVRVHTGPNESNTAIGECGPSWVHAYCQLQGGEVVYGAYRNDWWIYADTKIGNFINGYISDVFVQGGSNDAPVPGIPTC